MNSCPLLNNNGRSRTFPCHVYRIRMKTVRVCVKYISFFFFLWPFTPNKAQYNLVQAKIVCTILRREPPGLLIAYILHPLVRSNLWSFRSDLLFASFCVSGSNSDSLNTYILLSRPVQ